ncbi:MAG: Fic family protein, partial [Bacteroidota bacterium]
AKTLQDVLQLKERLLRKEIPAFGRRAPNASALLDLLYRTPYASAADVQKALKVTAPTANTLLDGFIKAKIIKEVTGGKRNRLFVFDEYVKLFSVRGS